MIKDILIIIALYLFAAHINYQIKTKDHSIQGFLEYMKDKYYTKH